MKSVEQSRPVQYERAEQQYNTDIYCRMYRSVDELLAYAHQTSPKVYRPFIMTEYLHTMGNSGGGLKEYMEVFESGTCRTRRLYLGLGRPVIQRGGMLMVNGIGRMAMMDRKIYQVLVTFAVMGW